MAGPSETAIDPGDGPSGGPSPLVVYAAYLETLPNRPNHGDHAFPRAAATTLCALALSAPALAWGREAAGHRPADGRWWTERALAIARRAISVAAFAPSTRLDMAWAALLLPVGALMGAPLVTQLGGAELWRGSSAAARAAAFSGRLDGVSAGARSLLVRLGQDEADGEDALARSLARPVLALAAGALSLELGWLGSPAVRSPAHPVARRLLLRYAARIEGRRERGTASGA